MASISVGLVGVTGYTGMELLRLLLPHPSFELVRVTSRAQACKKLVELFPFLAKTRYAGLEVTAPDPDDLASSCDLVFLAVPHGAAMELVVPLRRRGLKVVDFSADFRLREKAVYEQWYKPHIAPELIEEAVYGVPELYRDALAKTSLAANPGCYPTSAILGLAPALKKELIDTDGIVVDSKSGATGAGRKAAQASLFCEVSDSFRAYGIGKHRHTPEIEQELGVLAGKSVTVSFNPHLLPINRGILSTIYTRLRKEAYTEDVVELYQKFYEYDPWVRVQPAGKLPETRHVRGTMYCDIGLVADQRTGRLVIVSTIDNLCRGASGQALACANLMCGLPVSEGLDLPPLMP